MAYNQSIKRSGSILISFLSLLIFLPSLLWGQEPSAINRSSLYRVTYRPSIQWHQLKTPHYSILYPAGNLGEARASGRILEVQYNKARELVGGSMKNFPVILNPQNDRSNGFVSPMNFRMEVDLHPIQGKVLNPRSGNWLEAVLPHELIHALHLTHHDPAGLTSMIYPFSPDLARAVHTSVPLGILEGLAVHHETKSVHPGGGRGHYPYFMGPFHATYNTDQQWSMGQMAHISSQTRPFNRHYIGGYTFTRWLQKRYGSSTSRQAIGFYSRYPFLGYGIALRHVTGEWPGELYHSFENQSHQLFTFTDTTHSEVENSDSFRTLPLSYEGTEVRRPLWLSTDELLFYGAFYNGRPGFYQYHLNKNRSKRIYETRLVEDFRYDLSRKRKKLLYARYHTHPFFDRQSSAKIHELKISSGRTISSTSIDGFAPAYGSDSTLWSIRHRGATTVLQHQPRFDATEAKPSMYKMDSAKIVAVQPHPLHPDTLAIIANRRGVQGLWILSTEKIKSQLSTPPDIAFEDGSLFDPAWHPSGNRILFSSDHTGRLQIYEYILPARRIQQVTDHRSNAFEASYRPDGNWIAYVIQKKNQKVPAVLQRNDFLNRRIPRNRWQIDSTSQQNLHRPMIGDSLLKASRAWATSSYQTGAGWLKPRTVGPYLDSETNEIGLQAYSASLLNNHTYEAKLTYGLDELWYDLEYQNATFIPGFKLNVSRQPLLIESSDSLSHWERRRYGMEIPFSMTFENNTRFTALNIRPGLTVNQYRPYNSDHTVAGSFSHYLTSRFQLDFYYRLQQNLRDLQPNSGIYLFADPRIDLSWWNTRSRRRGIRTGAFVYLSPFRKLNQSLRLGTEWIFQSRDGPFHSGNLGVEGFRPSLFKNTPRAYELSTRYTVPLFYPDDGGFLVPLYLNRIYLVGFTRTIDKMETSFPSSFIEDSRTLYGGGLRFTFRISNLTIDLGIALTIEPTRDHISFLFGSF